MKIGKLIKKVRKARGLSKFDVISAINTNFEEGFGVSIEAYRQFEKGVAIPTEIVNLISSALKVPSNVLLSMTLDTNDTTIKSLQKRSKRILMAVIEANKELKIED